MQKAEGSDAIKKHQSRQYKTVKLRQRKKEIMDRNMSQYSLNKEQYLDTVKVSDGSLIFDTMLLNNYHIYIMYVLLQGISNGTTVKHIQKS